MMKIGSLFDGSGGFPLGASMAGMRAAWASEIEPFPIRVTSLRFPGMKHLGDISRISGKEIEPVDVITSGSPCTDMSIAGKRAGLDGRQSGLFHEAIRIVKEMREATDGRYPRYFVWENVPGAFSSNRGEDFRAVLEAVISVARETPALPMPDKGKWAYADIIMGDGFSVAYRVLDAQYWGVPQRRKRIYLVADFDGRSAGKILFESEGLSGYSAEGFQAWQEAAGCLADGSGETGRAGLCLNDQGGSRMDVTEDKTATLRAEAHHPPCVMFDSHGNDIRYTGPVETAAPVVRQYGTGGNNTPFVVSTPKTLKIRQGRAGAGGKGPLVQENKSATLVCWQDKTLFQPYGISSDGSNAMKSANPESGIYKADTSRTLDGNGASPVCNQGGIAVVESYSLQGSMIGRKEENGPQGDGVNHEVSFTLNATDRHAVASYGIDRAAFNQGKNGKFGILIDEELQPCMVSKGPGAVAVVASSKASFFSKMAEERAETLVATDYKDPPIVARTGSGGDVVGTLAASQGQKLWLGNQEAVSGDYHVIEPGYSVRRLTPTECARLQGFPDWWCADLGTDNPSDEDLAFWQEVFSTQARLLGKETKPKTERQLRKWLADPHTDSAEYKMWGNGVALPCVYFVMSGIAWAAGLGECSGNDAADTLVQCS